MNTGVVRTAAVLCLALLAGLSGGCNLINTALGLAVPVAGAKLVFSCLPEGTPIDTPHGPRPIETLRAGETVTGFEGEPVRILQIHAYAEDPVATEFLAVRFDDGAQVDLCGMHRIAGRRAGELRVGDEIAGRIVVAVEPHRGIVRSYDLLTEDRGYRIARVPVNSMIEEMILFARDGEFVGNSR